MSSWDELLKSVRALSSEGQKIKTPVLILKEHPHLDALMTESKEKAKFLRKKHVDLVEEINALGKEHWVNVEAYLAKVGLQIDKSKFSSVEIENGVLYKVEG